MGIGDSTSGRVCRITSAILAIASLIILNGCSFAYSSKSSSDIISSPFKSSSNSSKEQETAYQQQAADYSRAVAEVGGSESAAFQRGLSDLASRLGISDWEANPATWTSVGRGLGEARVSGAELATYAVHWSGGDHSLMDLMLQGYAETR